MLRHLFNEPKREDTGLLLEANRAMEDLSDKLQRLTESKGKSVRNVHKLQIWTKGLLTSLNELEQSQYCAEKYGRSIVKTSLEDMSEAEQDHYYLHVYFYKNAFIRLFSILDKLGYFINDMFYLKTEKTKPRFSYYTVLDQLKKRGIQPELEQKLTRLKLNYEKPMELLRKQRNTEIHYMNTEMMDDLERTYFTSYYTANEKAPLEDINQNLSILAQGFEMVTLTIRTVFQYSIDFIED